MNRKLLISLIGVLLCFYGFAFAQEPKYPTKPITIVVGYQPGGSTDIAARLIGPQITKALGQPVIIENRPGASQAVSAEHVARAPKDGYTLLMASGGIAVNPSLFPKLRYDPVKDFTPVAYAGISPCILMVRNSFPAKSIEEFIDVLKKNPGKFNYSSAGIGTQPHLAPEMLKLMTKTDFTHVAYNGSAPSMTALASGEVDFSISAFASGIGMVRAGKIRVLGIATEKRSPLMPELRTMIEGGLPGFVTGTWNMLYAPGGTPDHVINALNTAIVKAMQTEDFRAQLQEVGTDPSTMTPEDCRKYMIEEVERWNKVVKEANIKVE